MTIVVEIAPGELIDKITILEIKLEYIRDETQLVNVRREYKSLINVLQKEIVQTDELSRLTSELKGVNGELWRIEDDIRGLERAKTFDADFVALARSVYRTNDRRAALKRQINEILGSAIIEEKSYADY
jgi:predicted  nucleic acid-binding Zn-ribbon protein